jgi:nucleotide-binding universal stress UspA family protein
MFKKLLVPLDGSQLAEAALAPAAYLARCLGASVALIHIIERDAPQEVHGERHLNDPDEAVRYLEQVAATNFAHGRKVESHVHTSLVRDVPQSIADHVDEFAPDLIIMCTHGRSGLGMRLFGSIAQQVVALGKTPVMLVQPGAGDFECHMILVPLDGDPVHEGGMEVAASLAAGCGAALHLITVIQTLGTLTGTKAATGRMLPGATSAMLEITQEEAEAYLGDKIKQLESQGLQATASTLRGDPSEGIDKEALRLKADVIALATHGRSGMQAFWAGSVAAAVASRSKTPLLLVPIHPGREKT